MASIKVGNITYGAEDLAKCFKTYRKDFVIMPLLAMQALADNLTVADARAHITMLRLATILRLSTRMPM